MCRREEPKQWRSEEENMFHASMDAWTKRYGGFGGIDRCAWGMHAIKNQQVHQKKKHHNHEGETMKLHKK